MSMVKNAPLSSYVSTGELARRWIGYIGPNLLYLHVLKKNKYVIVFWWNMVPLHKNQQELLNVLLKTSSAREKATVRLSKTGRKPLSVIQVQALAPLG